MGVKGRDVGWEIQGAATLTVLENSFFKLVVPGRIVHTGRGMCRDLVVYLANLLAKSGIESNAEKCLRSSHIARPGCGLSLQCLSWIWCGLLGT